MPLFLLFVHVAHIYRPLSGAPTPELAPKAKPGAGGADVRCARERRGDGPTCAPRSTLSTRDGARPQKRLLGHGSGDLVGCRSLVTRSPHPRPRAVRGPPTATATHPTPHESRDTCSRAAQEFMCSIKTHDTRNQRACRVVIYRTLYRVPYRAQGPRRRACWYSPNRHSTPASA